MIRVPYQQPRTRVRDALEGDIPPIIFVTTGELPYWDDDTAHAILLVGLDDMTALINDPAFDEARLTSCVWRGTRQVVRWH